MNIALIGYGKMGKTIEGIALQRGHTLGLKIDHDSLSDFTKENLQQCDVAIEFTGPHSAKENIMKCLEAGVPTISGSTGWTQNLPGVENYCKEIEGSFLYASNFSVGVNIFFEVNKKLAQLMKGHEEYVVTLEEIHHTQKKDAPSGTAITLAEQVMAELTGKKKWVNHETEDPAELSIISKREDPAPGTHSIRYSSSIDDIEIRHTAHNRQGFALGAVLAAEFICDKKGIFSMKDVLNIA
ncbi:MAG TPA: 4-hydroxy-tetrahydrodipicolinate reductase [Ferruginibacter sp.]|jgi:4-hydroxy-tetrahydrodipicolinate reductase|nr:4-hydroxy-tetrahydrodipicolinate reductase [Ferruginibacter sp.]